jgi:hypothetical protein
VVGIDQRVLSTEKHPAQLEVTCFLAICCNKSSFKLFVNECNCTSRTSRQLPEQIGGLPHTMMPLLSSTRHLAGLIMWGGVIGRQLDHSWTAALGR